MDSKREELWPIDPSNRETGLPLEGIRVLDLSRVLAGPLAATVASDLGADVLKVEAPSGDPVRGLAPPWFEGDATYYLAVNRNRRNIVLDLRQESDRAHLAALAACADAVVDNYLPAQAAELGIDDLRASLPEVVWVTVGSADSAGPLADLPSFDLLAQAASGIMSVTGTPESGPLKVGIPVADVVAGLYAAIGLVTGLFAKVNAPEARALRIEAPLLESAISALINQAQGQLATGVTPGRLGNEHPSITPYAPYSTKDGEVLIAVATESEWLRLCSALGHPEDERFRSNGARVENRSLLRSVLEEILATLPSSEWLKRLNAARVPSAPINDVAAALHQEQVVSSGLVQQVQLSSGSVIDMVGSPLRVDGRRLPVRKRPPIQGEHGGELGPKTRED